MMSDAEFLAEMEKLERAATNLKNDFRRYNYKDYIDGERTVDGVKTKTKVLYQMMENMVENRIAMMELGHEAIKHRRQLIKQIGNNPHIKEHWDTIMMALMLTE